jgi:hypothetical protein
VSVKYARLRGKGDKGTVVSTGTYPYNGELPHLEFILSDIRGREGNVKAAIGISSQDILKKSVTIPIIPKEEVKEALDWSISKTIASPLEEMIYDYVMLGEVEERGIRKEEACFVGAQKTFVNDLLASFRRSGFGEIILVTDIGLAYQGIMGVKRGGAAAVIDVGGTQSGIYLFEGKQMRLVREIMIGAESASDALMSGIDLRAKEKGTLIETGFLEGTIGLSESSFEKLTGEIQRTFSVFEKRYPDKPLKRIYIAGRGSQIPDFLPRLIEKFGETVKSLKTRKSAETEFLPSHLPAVLLAAYPESLVNLLPEDIREKRKEAVYRKWIAYGSAGIAVMLIIASVDMLMRLNGLNAANRVEAASVARMKEGARMLSTTAVGAKYNDLTLFVKEVEKRDETFVVLLKYLSSRLPTGVYLKAIEFGLERQELTPPPMPKKEAPQAAQGLADPSRSVPKQGAGQSPLTEETLKGRLLVIKGYVLGEVDVADPALLDLVIRLGETGIVHNVEVIQREVKTMKGKRIIEFTLMGRCVPYEV